MQNHNTGAHSPSNGGADAVASGGEAAGLQTDVLDGKAFAEAVRAQVAARAAALQQQGIRPSLAVVRVGDDPASAIYVRAKLRSAKALGIHAVEHTLPAHASQDAVEARVGALCGDHDIDGVLVQLPLPAHIDADRVLALVDADKDVDGLGVENLGLLAIGAPGLRPCTPAGVMVVLQAWSERSGFSLRGARALVIGRSRIVGKPMAQLLLAADATVTIAHSRSANLASEVARADVVVAAAGVPHLVQGAWLKPGAVVIDVGIHRGADGKLLGDVDTASTLGRAGAVTPVPGGVGPLTIAMLMSNTVQAAETRRSLRAERRARS